MWEVILKEKTLVMHTILQSYQNLGYEYFYIGTIGGRESHHLVCHLGTEELGDLIMDILEENERRDTLERFDIERFRFGMQNPNMGILVQLFSHIVYQLTFDEVKNLVENNDDLMLAKLTIIAARRDSDVVTIYKFVDGTGEIYGNVVRESEKIQTEIDRRGY
jgi:hypothetical protein